MTAEIKKLEAKLKQLRDAHYQEITKQENQQLQSYVGRYFILGTVDVELIKVTGVEGNEVTVIQVSKNDSVFSTWKRLATFENIVEITEEAFNKVLSETLYYLNPNQPQEVEVWAYMAGEYAAFHETHIRVIYDLTNELIVQENWFEDGVEETLKKFEETDYSNDDSVDFSKCKALKVGDKYYLEL